MGFIKTPLFQSTWLRLLVPPLVGFCCYGGWAYWANIDYGHLAGVKAACTQGGYSFAITLVLSLLIEGLFKRLYRLPYRSVWVGLIACVLLYGSSWWINKLMATPNILLTILPGAVISTLYTCVYIKALNKL